jgi:hypothetical protein
LRISSAVSGSSGWTGGADKRLPDRDALPSPAGADPGEPWQPTVSAMITKGT